MKNLLRFLAFVLMVGSAYAQNNLPACQGRETAKWSDCFGTVTLTVELQRKVSHYLQPILSHRFLNNLA
jgi:hypothetical protein